MLYQPATNGHQDNNDLKQEHILKVNFNLRIAFCSWARVTRYSVTKIIKLFF
jgi:hypothetical protein